MIDLAFVAAFVTFPLLITWAMWRLDFCFFEVSIPAFTVIAMFAFAYIGTLPLYFMWDEVRPSNWIT